MTLLLRTPTTYLPERRWVLGVVLDRWWGIEWRHLPEERDDVRIESVAGPGPSVTLPDVLFATPPHAWLGASTLPSVEQDRRPVGVAGAGVLDADERLPVLYGTAGSTLMSTDDHGVHLHVDVLGGVFFMLSRYEELVGTDRDRHGRFPAATSTAHRHGFLRLPVVDAYVDLLWRACAHVWPRLSRRTSHYRVSLTHDVDEPLSTLGRGARGRMRQLAGDLVRRRDPGLMARRARSLAAARRGDHTADPNNTFELLMDVSERHGLRSAFYVLPHRTDGPAPVDLLAHPWVRDLIGRVHRRGHEVGYHADYDTHLDAERTRAEFDRLRRVAEAQGVQQPRWGGRQHYLRWTNPETWRHWEAAGLDYDCTVGHAEAAGFRTGTARDYPVFDLTARRVLDLVEEPFQVMDVTLFGSMGLVPDAARDTTLEIARACRRFGGTLGLLWHNDSVLRTAREQRWYASLVEAVATV